jgi:signal transduction histidine kinase
VASQHKQKVILDECDLMSRLIQSMLTIASSDAGNWKMNKKEVDINTLLIEVWEAFNEPARKKNIQLNLDIEEYYPHIVCDKERIFQVLGILLDNAIAYSAPESSIELGAKGLSKQIAFYVKDHGPGIADKDKEKVFERFYSGDPSRTDKSHYGLGLSIAQEIVKLHQGTILLKDTLNGGCTFEIRIPLEQEITKRK